MDETTDYRTKSDEPTRRLLGTALLYWARAWRSHIYSTENDGEGDEWEMTWEMKCREADELVGLYEDAHRTGRLYLPILPFDLWAGEEVIMGAALYYQKNLAVWDDQPDTTSHRDIFVVHHNCPRTYHNTIFLNQVFDAKTGNRYHFDLKHHPNPVFHGK